MQLQEIPSIFALKYALLCEGKVKKNTKKDWSVPRVTDRKIRVLLKTNYSLGGLTPEFNRCKTVFQRNTVKIVEMNVFRDELLNFGA